MPDAAGNFKGIGWSQKRSDAYDRIFGPKPSPSPYLEINIKGQPMQQRSHPAFPNVLAVEHKAAALAFHAQLFTPICCNGLGPCSTCPRRPVPHEPSPEVPPDCNGCGQDGHVLDDCPAHPER